MNYFRLFNDKKKVNFDDIPYVQIKDNNLIYRDHKIKVKEAKEPRDINWTQIYETRVNLNKSIVKSNLYFMVFICICLAVILNLKYIANEFNSYSTTLTSEGNAYATIVEDLAYYFNYSISVMIVFYNKFFLS